MKVAGYVRVSTEEQREEGSHERQREQLQEWADRKGHDLALFEDIAISGQADDRPDYQALMDRAAEFDAVAVRELSRFGRNLRKILNDIHELGENDTDFLTLNGEIDTTTAQGKLLFNMVGAFNQFWADVARERAQAEVERRRAAGEPIGRPKKLTAEQREEAREWREKGLSYRAVTVVIEDTFGVEVAPSTVYRYCQGEA